MHLWPRFLPDGRHFLYLSEPADRDEWAIFVGSLDSPERRLLVRADSMAEFAPPDQVLFVRSDTLFSQTMDMDALTLVGEPVLVAQPIFVTIQGRAACTFRLQYRRSRLPDGTGIAKRRRTQPLGHVGRPGRPGRACRHPRARLRVFADLADGTRVALDARDAENDIWIWDFARKTLTRLTFSAALDRSPVWAPD